MFSSSIKSVSKFFLCMIEKKSKVELLLTWQSNYNIINNYTVSIGGSILLA